MNFNLTFIGQMVAFAIFVWFCGKFVWPPLTKAIDARRKIIADGLMSADRASKDLELAQERATKIIREAKQEASGIVDAANRRAAKIVDDSKDKGRAEAERIKIAAQAEIDQEMEHAREQLRSQVATLALAGATKVLEASVDESAHKAMLDKLAVNL